MPRVNGTKLRKHAEKTQAEDELIATAYILMHGVPPKSLITEISAGPIRKSTVAARDYCARLESFIRERIPGISPTSRIVRRNRVLRIMKHHVQRTSEENP